MPNYDKLTKKEAAQVTLANVFKQDTSWTME